MQPSNRDSATSWREDLAAIDPHAATLPASLDAARKLRAHGKADAAIEAYRAAAQQDAPNPSVLGELGALLASVGRRDEARQALAEMCALEADGLGVAAEDRAEVAAYLLARKVGDAAPPRAPDAYVRAMFDRAAEQFDERLVGRLSYCGPQLLAGAVRLRLGERTASLRVMDAGCGTGLAAEFLRPMASQLEGVDLSAEMVEKARARDQYDRLIMGELAASVSGEEPYDLIFAADVFSYIGDLEGSVAACRDALVSGGLLAATVEAARGEEGYSLTTSGRYRHSPAYLERTLGQAGLVSVELQEAVVRHEAGVPVDSLLITAVRADTESP